MNETALRTS